MSEYDDNCRGAMFKRQKEPGQENRPDYSGPLNVDGVDWEIAAWVSESRAGNKYLSLKVSPPYKKDGDAPQATAGTSLPDPEDIPF